MEEVAAGRAVSGNTLVATSQAGGWVYMLDLVLRWDYVDVGAHGIHKVEAEYICVYAHII